MSWTIMTFCSCSLSIDKCCSDNRKHLIYYRRWFLFIRIAKDVINKALWIYLLINWAQIISAERERVHTRVLRMLRDAQFFVFDMTSVFLRILNIPLVPLSLKLLSLFSILLRLSSVTYLLYMQLYINTMHILVYKKSQRKRHLYVYMWVKYI